MEVLGELDYHVGQRSIIRSFVGYLDLNYSTLVGNEEVQRLFTLPLDYLVQTDPIHYTVTMRPDLAPDFPKDLINQGHNYPHHRQHNTLVLYALQDYSEYLWGFTASLTHRFIQWLKEEDLVSPDKKDLD